MPARAIRRCARSIDRFSTDAAELMFEKDVGRRHRKVFGADDLIDSLSIPDDQGKTEAKNRHFTVTGVTV
jgi:hypothetical protein